MDQSKPSKAKRQYKALRLTVLMQLAFKNLMHKKLRSLLTIFGVIIGISAIFFLLSFGLGIQNMVTTEVIGDKSLKAIEVTSPNSKILKLNDEAVNNFRKIPNVEKVGLQFSAPGSVSISGGEIDAVVYGVNKDYQELTPLNLIKGRLLRPNDTDSVVVNTSVLNSVGFKDKQDEVIGKKINLVLPLNTLIGENKTIVNDYEVVGVIESGSGSEIFAPDTIFTGAGANTYQQVKVVASSMDDVDGIRKQIESSGFQTTSLTDTLSEINQIFKFFNIILISFGSVGMIVAILGMFNTLTISLLERTREIGLMVALGARKSDMRKLFIFEAGLISFIGAVVGIGLAIVGGWIVDGVLNANARQRGVTEAFSLFSTPLLAILIVIIGTVIVGLVVVYVPARRAERINPIDALRRE